MIRMGSVRSFAILLSVAGWFAASVAPAVPPAVAESRIESIGLFKNGLAVVSRVVEVDGPGEYRLEDLPVPVHGTWWVESASPVETRVTTEEVATAFDRTTRLNLQQDLAGRSVTVHFLDDGVPSASGRVVDLEPSPDGPAWSREYEQERYASWWFGSRSISTAAAPDSAFLVLDTAAGRSYIRKDRIASIESSGGGETVVRRRPVGILVVGEGGPEQPQVRIGYLTKGIAWAPSYQVDLGDPARLVLRQKAVVKNEMESFSQAKLYLISGFPSIEFSHVSSPLSLFTNWAEFFRQLNRRVGQGAPTTRNVVMQQAVGLTGGADAGGASDLSAVPAGEGPDLHYHPIGPRDMREGDALALDLASEEAEYTRIVEWIIPDTRQPDGRYVDEYVRRQDPDAYDESAWDAVRFRNPFDFPMTTGPAMVVAQGRFLGQRTSFWTNRGEETSLRITKALSLRTRHVEREEPGEREIVMVGGRGFRKTTVAGKATVDNHRDETVTLVVRRRFSGNLLDASGEPRKELLESGVYSVNPRNELTWEADLEPGGELTLDYRYEVLQIH